MIKNILIFVGLALTLFEVSSCSGIFNKSKKGMSAAWKGNRDGVIHWMISVDTKKVPSNLTLGSMWSAVGFSQDQEMVKINSLL
jgi:hypothetical protein